jgi:hypothetical protein
LHSVKKLRIDRVTDIGGTYTITLQFIATDYHDNEGTLELTLFDPPLDQMIKLYMNFKDADSRWLGEDWLEESAPLAVAATEELSKDFDHIRG